MANFQINSKISNIARVDDALQKYLYDRVWGDDELLTGFEESEIDETRTFSGSCRLGWQDLH